MRNTRIFACMGMVVFLSLTVSAVAGPVEIVGTLQNVDGVSLSGRITVIQESSSGVAFTHHEVKVKVVDALGQAVPGAALRVRYHEPEKPMRRVSLDTEEITDSEGSLMLRGVGIQVPFVVDVQAPNYPPASSKQTKLAAGETRMEDIVLGEPEASGPLPLGHGRLRHTDAPGRSVGGVTPAT